MHKTKGFILSNSVQFRRMGVIVFIKMAIIMIRWICSVIFVGAIASGCDSISSVVNSYDSDFNDCASIYQKKLKFQDTAKYSNIEIQEKKDALAKKITFRASAKNKLNQDVLSNVVCRVILRKPHAIWSVYDDDELIGGDYKELIDNNRYFSDFAPSVEERREMLNASENYKDTDRKIDWLLSYNGRTADDDKLNKPSEVNEYDYNKLRPYLPISLLIIIIFIYVYLFFLRKSDLFVKNNCDNHNYNRHSDVDTFCDSDNDIQKKVEEIREKIRRNKIL